MSADELCEIFDRLLELSCWPRRFDGEPQTVAAVKNLTSELIGRFCDAALLATRPAGSTPLARYAHDLEVPRQQRMECALLKGVTAFYVMGRAGAVAAQARERAVLTELAAALAAGAPDVLDPMFRPAYESAGSDAARLRVVVDQVASLTDTSALAWHAKLCPSRARRASAEPGWRRAGIGSRRPGWPAADRGLRVTARPDQGQDLAQAVERPAVLAHIDRHPGAGHVQRVDPQRQEPGRDGRVAPQLADRHRRVEPQQRPQQVERRGRRPRLRRARRRVADRLGELVAVEAAEQLGQPAAEPLGGLQDAAEDLLRLAGRSRTASGRRRRSRCRAARSTRCDSSSGCRRRWTRPSVLIPKPENMSSLVRCRATAAALPASTMPVHRQWPMLEASESICRLSPSRPRAKYPLSGDPERPVEVVLEHLGLVRPVVGAVGVLALGAEVRLGQVGGVDVALDLGQGDRRLGHRAARRS